ncbi:MAG TPA: acyl-CoA dehydrogenase family protein, partial [Xanthobacteraceae bacterium]
MAGLVPAIHEFARNKDVDARHKAGHDNRVEEKRAMNVQPLFREDHALFRASVKRFIEREVAPHHARWEKEGVVSREVWKKAGEAGMLLTDIPTEYGGGGADFLTGVILNEEMTRGVYTGPGFRVHSDICAPYILHYGSEEQKKKWLPRMARGETICAIAMTEPGTGSDLQAVRTTAKREGDEYVINGQKTFITNGQLSDLVIVVAKTDTTKGAKGTSLILVERERAGFTRGRNLEKLGMHAQDTSELFFADVRVPAENLLGTEGGGFIAMMQNLPRERVAIGTAALAGAEKAFEETLEYCKQREAFGRPIGKFQHNR